MDLSNFTKNEKLSIFNFFYHMMTAEDYVSKEEMELLAVVSGTLGLEKGDLDKLFKLDQVKVTKTINEFKLEKKKFFYELVKMYPDDSINDIVRDFL